MAYLAAVAQPLLKALQEASSLPVSPLTSTSIWPHEVALGHLCGGE
jgi:hypothetical protein